MPKGGALPGKGDPQAGNGVVVQGEGGPHKFSGFPVHTGDEDVAAPTLPHSGGNAADLLRGLARPVDDLGRPLADTPVEVHLGVAQIRKGLGFELQQRVLRRGAPSATARSRLRISCLLSMACPPQSEPFRGF